MYFICRELSIAEIIIENVIKHAIIMFCHLISMQKKKKKKKKRKRKRKNKFFPIQLFYADMRFTEEDLL